MYLAARFSRITKLVNEGWTPDWTDDRMSIENRKHYICWSSHEKKFIIYWSSTIVSAMYYFKSKEDAEIAIEALGEDRLKTLMEVADA